MSSALICFIYKFQKRDGVEDNKEKRWNLLFVSNKETTVIFLEMNVTERKIEQQIKLQKRVLTVVACARLFICNIA
jgi:hypothetical protein